ncbi:MAG: alpha/beta fold hydrolase [Rubrivivax sp.]|nr:alpha/beta fold hydrolase [Rubrivivax sp.]
MGDAVVPFRIEATDEQLADLKRRLLATRWPDKEPVADWSQGLPLAYAQELCRYWAHDYDWGAREARLNRFAQFKTPIDGVDIHFVHVRSKHADALPLVMTHGWPGSIAEFHKVIEPLTDPTEHGGDAADAFHLVCPALPGYGFSGKPGEAGWSVERIARAWATLMRRLGYVRYVAQGGDWGSMVTTAIGLQDHGPCLGIHLTMPIVAPDPATMQELTADREGGVGRAEALPCRGLGLCAPAGHAAADPGVRPGGFTRRPGRLGGGEVPGLDGLRRASGERAQPRRTAGPGDAVLAAQQRHLVGAPVLGELRQAERGAGAGAHRHQLVPEGDLPLLAALGRSALQAHRALARTRSWRAFRRAGAARGAGRRDPQHLPPAAYCLRHPPCRSTSASSCVVARSSARSWKPRWSPRSAGDGCASAS